MKVNHQRKLLEEVLNKYRNQLDTIPDELFDQTPPNGGWSAAELYSHILQADFGSLIASEKCARKTAEHTGKGLNAVGLFVFMTGIFPPVKTKAPAALAAVTKKIAKEEARNLLIKVRNRLEIVMQLLNDQSAKNYKVKHPRLGMLNAAQWIKFTRIHTEHHFKQLLRIKKELGLIS